MPRFALSLLMAVAISATSSLQAQCLGPDNLAGPCCTFVADTLPSFPSLSLPSENICWDSCSVNSQTCSTVTLTPPVRVNCAEYTTSFDNVDCSGTALLKGTLHLDYTRTWEEFPFPGQQNQVWRFIVKADLTTSSGTFGCTVPSCLGTHNTAFYYGYLDYSFDCASLTWEAALVLYHGCDRYQHDLLLSSRPGSFHPNRTFAVVAPTTTANPFVPAILTPTPGTLAFDGMRDAAPVTPPPFVCEANESIQLGQLFNLGSACVCPFSLFPPQTTARHLDGTSFCGSSFRTVSAFPALPWFEMMSFSLGTWSSGANYPGPEAVWVDEGTFLHFEACTASGAPETYAEVKYGATTEGGYLAAVGPVPADRFTDLVDNYSALLGTPIVPPFFGSVNPTRHLVFVNPF